MKRPFVTWLYMLPLLLFSFFIANWRTALQGLALPEERMLHLNLAAGAVAAAALLYFIFLGAWLVWQARSAEAAENSENEEDKERDTQPNIDKRLAIASTALCCGTVVLLCGLDQVMNSLFGTQSSLSTAYSVLLCACVFGLLMALRKKATNPKP